MYRKSFREQRIHFPFGLQAADAEFLQKIRNRKFDTATRPPKILQCWRAGDLTQ